MLELKMPIHVFSVSEFGIDLRDFQRETSPIFYNLPLDIYDSKKQQIVFFKDHLHDICDQRDVQNQLFDYYKDPLKNEKNCEKINGLYQLLKENEKKQFDQIKPFRRRAVSTFIFERQDDIQTSKRIPTPSFSQTDAKIEGEGFDFRKLPRIFTEIDDKHIDTPMFKSILKGIANKVIDANPHINCLDITVHHVLVETSFETPTSNSPEGIHQDGYDYIVSALVVERNNVSGGVSEIFESDKTTKILSTVLQPGQGILQPDKNTCLWHHVTKLLVTSRENSGYRSSIGFDIALRQS